MSITRAAAYTAAIICVAVGIFFLGAELLIEETASPYVLLGYVIAGSAIGVGVVLAAAVRSGYAGGVWFLLGIVFSATALIGWTSVLEDALWTHRPIDTLPFSLIQTALGALFLYLAHRRHRHRRPPPPPSHAPTV